MALDGFRARLDSLLAEYLRRPDQRAYTAGLHDALVELKLGVDDLVAGVARSERELAAERQHLEDAERRGRLAAGIGDTETATIAAQFADKHRERIALLERKLAVQHDEVTLAQREYQDLSERYRSARQGVPPSDAGAPSADELQAETDRLQMKMDREAAARAVEAQLALLKKKLGKQ